MLTEKTVDAKKYQAEFEVKKKKNRKWFNILFFAINVVILAVIILMEKDNGGTRDIWDTIYVVGQNIEWFLMIVLMYVLVSLGDTFSYTSLIRSTTKKTNIRLGLKTGVFGRYYDNITPLASGGQAFQIYYLSKGGVQVGTASGIVLMRYIVKQLVSNVLMLCFFLFSSYEGTEFMRWMAYVGLTVTSAIPLFFIMISINKKVGLKATTAVLTLLHKLKLVKNFQHTLEKIMGQVEEFQRSVKYLLKNKGVLVIQIAMSLLDCFAYISIPYFVYRAFGNTGDSWMTLFTLYMYCLCAVALMPTPGTAGAAEASFYSLFAAFISDGMVFWALLVWRFFTYYIFLVVGACYLLSDLINKFLDKNYYVEASRSEYEEVIDTAKLYLETEAYDRKMLKSGASGENADGVADSATERAPDDTSDSKNGNEQDASEADVSQDVTDDGLERE